MPKCPTDTSAPVPKCLDAEVSWCRSVRTPIIAPTALYLGAFGASILTPTAFDLGASIASSLSFFHYFRPCAIAYTRSRKLYPHLCHLDPPELSTTAVTMDIGLVTVSSSTNISQFLWALNKQTNKPNLYIAIDYLWTTTSGAISSTWQAGITFFFYLFTFHSSGAVSDCKVSWVRWLVTIAPLKFLSPPIGVSCWTYVNVTSYRKWKWDVRTSCDHGVNGFSHAITLLFSGNVSRFFQLRFPPRSTGTGYWYGPRKNSLFSEIAYNTGFVRKPITATLKFFLVISLLRDS